MYYYYYTIINDWAKDQSLLFIYLFCSGCHGVNSLNMEMDDFCIHSRHVCLFMFVFSLWGRFVVAGFLRSVERGLGNGAEYAAACTPGWIGVGVDGRA